MGKKEKRRTKFEEAEEEEEARKLTKSVGSDDDAEANEDLSLKIVEKALLMRAAKLHESGVDGGVTLVDNTGGAAVMELLTSSSSLEAATEAAFAGSSGIRKKKKRKKAAKKMATCDEPATIVEEEKKAEAVKKAEEAVEAAEKLTEGTEPSAVVEEPVNVVLRKLLRGPRYFDPPDAGGWPACYKCGEEGHMAVNCRSLTKKLRPCFVCGSLEHGAKQCPKARDCFICKSGGHRAKDCPDKYNGILRSSKVCLKCGGSGHDLFSCKNDYSASDLEGIQCYICMGFGHLCCANHIDDSQREVSCYKCGELGHTGLACLRLRKEATSVASPSLCFKCGEEGHFSRDCSSAAKSGKRNHESSTPTRRAHKGSDEVSGVKSAPHDLGKPLKRRKTKSEESGITTPRRLKRKGGWVTEDPGDAFQIKRHKSKHKGGWIQEDPGDLSQIKPHKSKYRGGWKAEDSQGFSPSTPHRTKRTGGWITEDPPSHSNSKKNHWRSRSTPSSKNHKISTINLSGYYSPSSEKMHGRHLSTPLLHGSSPAFQNRVSVSRYGNSTSDHMTRNYEPEMRKHCSYGLRRNHHW